MFKNHWLLSVIACAGLWNTALPVKGQALTPYVPSLNAEKLEQRGLELAENAVQLVRFQQYDAALSQAKTGYSTRPESLSDLVYSGNSLFANKKRLTKELPHWIKPWQLNRRNLAFGLL